MKRFVPLALCVVVMGCVTSKNGAILRGDDGQIIQYTDILEVSHRDAVRRFAPEVVDQEWDMLMANGAIGSDRKHYASWEAIYQHPEDPDTGFRFYHLHYIVTNGTPRLAMLTKGRARRRKRYVVLESEIVSQPEVSVGHTAGVQLGSPDTEQWAAPLPSEGPPSEGR